MLKMLDACGGWPHSTVFSPNCEFQTDVTARFMTGPGIEGARSPRIPGDVLFAVLDGQAVLLNLATGVYHGLDAVGTRIWQLLSEQDSLEGVRAAMLEEFEVEPERLDRDLGVFLAEMLERGLLEADGEASTDDGARRSDSLPGGDRSTDDAV
jgi:hypothetical protein